MRKPNYSHEKRQKEIAKQKKREAKRLKKAGDAQDEPQAETREGES